MLENGLTLKKKDKRFIHEAESLLHSEELAGRIFVLNVNSDEIQVLRFYQDYDLSLNGKSLQ